MKTVFTSTEEALQFALDRISQLESRVNDLEDKSYATEKIALVCSIALVQHSTLGAAQLTYSISTYADGLTKIPDLSEDAHFRLQRIADYMNAFADTLRDGEDDPRPPFTVIDGGKS